MQSNRHERMQDRQEQLRADASEIARLIEEGGMPQALSLEWLMDRVERGMEDRR